MRSRRDTLPEGTPPQSDEGSTSQLSIGDDSQRITISSLPKSVEAVTGRRPRVGDAELSARVMERLLELWGELPVAGGERAVMRAVVEAAASFLPEAQVGACLVPAGGGAQEVIRAAEGSGIIGGAGADPARLFAAASYERVITVEHGGTTLHVAGEDPAYEDQEGALGVLLSRIGTMAHRGLELARIQARAEEALAEARSLNAHIVQAEKLASLGQIAAGVVHELNNPLTSIVAYTDYLIRKASARAGSDPDELDRLKRIGESAGRMLRFTRDLVSYARPSSETSVPVSAHLVIDQAIAFCEHVIAGASVTVERHFAPDLPAVHGKPEQLAQVFVNLVTNACHAMAGDGGTLTVRTRADEDAIYIEIADTGHGILPEHVPQVFTPFFTTKASGAGTGLGLAIVKSILDGHGGAIRAASDGRRGATFFITLPVPR
jgi:signal transduction histidine kinase